MTEQEQETALALAEFALADDHMWPTVRAFMRDRHGIEDPITAVLRLRSAAIVTAAGSALDRPRPH